MYPLDFWKKGTLSLDPNPHRTSAQRREMGIHAIKGRSVGVGVNTPVTLRMNDRLIFLRLFKADTLRRLHHLSF